jgi:hypothetical protein
MPISAIATKRLETSPISAALVTMPNGNDVLIHTGVADPPELRRSGSDREPALLDDGFQVVARDG